MATTTIENDDIENDENYKDDLSKANVEDATMLRIEEQQRQINLLMKMVQQQNKNLNGAIEGPSLGQSQVIDASKLHNGDQKSNVNEVSGEQLSESLSSTPSSMSTKTNTNVGVVAPLKAMMFIDGTWLYYSIHERGHSNKGGLRCPITQKFGRGWQQHYAVDWASLPRVVCEELQRQQVNQGWSSVNKNNENTGSSTRPVDIVRASVYTSYKKSTKINSLRAKMFEEMNEANYDVHLMETLGAGEKCVDIQLAVEMLHYATVPNAYDVAIMLSGDKDFIPALIRTRQKGKQTAIVSMKIGCNRALDESPHVKDYDTVWLDDFIDRIIVPLPKEDLERRQHTIVSPSSIVKVVHEFISQASVSVSSRDIGRYLKTVKVVENENSNLLIQLKEVYGGLRFFLTLYGLEVFEITDKDTLGRDKGSKGFWVGILEDAKEYIIPEEERSKFSENEEMFLQRFESRSASENGIDEFSFYHTNEDQNSASFFTPDEVYSKASDFKEKDFDLIDEKDLSKLELPDELMEDFSTYTVAKLKDYCRERGLMVSGTKAVLLQRVRDEVKEQTKAIWQRQQQHERELHQSRQLVASKMSNISRPIVGLNGVKAVDSEVVNHLEGLIEEYIQASGGEAGSRNLGRYLSANSSSNGESSALSELKHYFGSMRQFLINRSDVFALGEPDNSSPGVFGFPIRLR